MFFFLMIRLPPSSTQSRSSAASDVYKILIVGPTGAGKTTLVNLIMRFYELDDGSISLEDRELAPLRPEAPRSHIPVVLQATWLVSGTNPMLPRASWRSIQDSSCPTNKTHTD